ncbi:MAG: CBS domain-containing protein [Chthonomonas sp.]|nr:CBS domain-containing protein [Chthonomonas sp.]
MILQEVLHAHIPVLTQQSTLRDAIDKMDIYQFPALVIVDQGPSPVAVITEGDIARAVQGVGNLTSLAALPAIGYGTANPTTAPIGMEISDALHLMLMSGLTILPVVDGDIFRGVVLRVDLMQAVLLDGNIPEPKS